MSDTTEKKTTSRRPQPRRSALAGANPITPPPAPAPEVTTQDTTTQAQKAAPVPTVAESKDGATTATSKTAAPTTRTTKAAPASSAERLGIYLTADEFRDARGAYLADWTNGGEADTFGRWVAAAIATHARRTPKQREGLARPVGRAATRTGESRSWPIASEAIQAMREAIAADQEAGRWPSDSAWCGDAITATTAAARKANGGTLPEPPARLPNRLKRA